MKAKVKCGFPRKAAESFWDRLSQKGRGPRAVFAGRLEAASSICLPLFPGDRTC